MRKDPKDEMQQITLTDQDGNEALFNVLLTFHSDDFDRSYILIYPAGQQDDGEVGIQAFALANNDDPTNPQGGDLIPIEKDEEWDMVESVLNTFMSNDDQ